MESSSEPQAVATPALDSATWGLEDFRAWLRRLFEGTGLRGERALVVLQDTQLQEAWLGDVCTKPRNPPQLDVWKAGEVVRGREHWCRNIVVSTV